MVHRRVARRSREALTLKAILRRPRGIPSNGIQDAKPLISLTLISAWLRVRAFHQRPAVTPKLRVRTHRSHCTAKHLIPSNTTIKAIKAGDARSRLSDGDGSLLVAVRQRRL